MPVKSIADLRLRFVNDGTDPGVPTAQDYIDLVDTLMAIQSQVVNILLPLMPVLVVADEAERLLLGPTLDRYRKVKQTDNGITYVRQQDPGSDPGDWEAIGDVDIIIPDVNNLDAELMLRISKLYDDSTTGKVGAKHFRESYIALDNSSQPSLDWYYMNNGLTMAYRDQDFDLYAVTQAPDSWNGRSVLFVQNTAGIPIEVTPGSGPWLPGFDTADLIPSEAITFPVVIAPSAWRRFEVAAITAPLGSSVTGRQVMIY